MHISHDKQPTNEQIKAHKALKEVYEMVETAIDSYVTPGREKSLAITNLEQSLMWAGKGIYFSGDNNDT